MEFYLSVSELLGKTANPLILIFVPIFLFTALVEALLILHWQGTYPWKNAGVSISMAVGHFITQIATYGVVFGIIAMSVYEIRLTTIPISFRHWLSLIALYLLADLAFYVEHRCSHRIGLLWASHSVHHSSEKMLVTTAFRLSWTPILSGVFLFYLPIVWIGYDPAWVYGMVSASLTYQFFVHTELVPRAVGGVGHQHALSPSRAPCEQCRIPRQKLRRRSAGLGSFVRVLSGRAARHSDPLWPVATAARPPTTLLSSPMRDSG